MLQATTRIDPPTLSNLVAMEALVYGRGEYQSEEIAGIFSTALTGFRAVSEKTTRVAPQERMVIHTGWWGCGAYGGNRELMALLQLLAAEWAEVAVLVFHVGESDSERWLN